MADTGEDLQHSIEGAAHDAGEAVTHAAEDVAAAGHEGAEAALHHARHPQTPPELVSFTQWWYDIEHHGANPHHEDIHNLTPSEVLHIGRLKEPAPIVNYAPWENNLFAFIGAIIIMVFFFLITGASRASRKSAFRRPGRGQALAEMIVGGFESFCSGILGPKNGRIYMSYIGTLFFFILVNNLMGLIPLMKASTSYILIPASLALLTFLHVQATAWFRLGPVSYIYHLMGQPKDLITWCLSPLFLVLEIIGEIAKPISLTLRLFGNIMGKDILLGAFVMMGIMLTNFVSFGGDAKLGDWIGLPLTFPFYFLGLLLSSIQALVFSLLSTIYISLVLPHDHDHGHDGHGHEGEGAHGHGEAHAH